MKYGYLGCEPHYNKISPLVIAEEFLKEDNGFCSINDYKFWWTFINTNCMLEKLIEEGKLFLENPDKDGVVEDVHG